MFLREKPFEFIVIHHSATSTNKTLEDLEAIHLGIGFSCIGYHFFINENGMAVGRSDKYIGAHCLPDKEPYLQWCMNEISCGVVVPGNFCLKYNPTIKVVNELAYGVKTLCKKYGLEVNRKVIIPHFAASSTACPGRLITYLYKKLGI